MTAPLQPDDWVRVKILPANCRPTPLLVTKILPNGMIRLLGWAGDFAPHLFVKVDPPQTKRSA
jgi:hypothetical protein